MGKNNVEVVIINGTKRLNEKRMEEGLDHENLPVNIL